MNNSVLPSYLVDCARAYPRLTNVGIGCLLVIVVVIELMTTEAPVVLYQAF